MILSPPHTLRFAHRALRSMWWGVSEEESTYHFDEGERAARVWYVDSINCTLPSFLRFRHVPPKEVLDGREERNPREHLLTLLTMMFSVSGSYVPTVNDMQKECWMNYVTNG